MKFFRTFLFIGALFTSFEMAGQDVHFSLFHMSPLTLNPAQTGAFEGTARVGGIYRDQWASILRDQFTTPSFYVDAPIIRGFGKNDWVGVGGLIYNDKAGKHDLGTNASLLSAAYHLAVQKNSRDHMLTLGVQFGSIQRKIKTDSLLFGQNIDFSRSNPLLFGLGEETINTNNSFADIGAGLMLRSKMNDEMNLEVGLSFSHINQGDYSFTNSADDQKNKRPMLITGHGRLRYQFSELWRVTPGFLVRTTRGTKPEIAVQGWMGRKINDEFTFNFGAAYRLNDAAEALVGIDYNEELRVALSYDINTSSLSNISKGRGGFELAAYYIIKIYKQPDVTPSVLCPKF